MPPQMDAPNIRDARLSHATVLKRNNFFIHDSAAFIRVRTRSALL